MSSPLSANRESILDRFDAAWNDPTPPRIEDYLPAAAPAKRLALLVELVRIDLERRLVRGERIRLEETYLPRFPELNGDPASVVSLASWEFEIRRRREPNLSPDEYLQRWPKYRGELERLLGLRPTLTTTGETHDGKPHKDGRHAAEETRDVIDLLSPPQAADELGRLSSYRILKVLGSGGMGAVFLAEDAQLQRPVALKVMRPGLAANDAARQRFLREARAMAALKHDRIVTIYQVDEARGVPFLAMEHLEGETLHERLKRETLLPLDEAMRISGEIADALSVAHSRGLIHRDIKPANIWLEHPNRSLTVAALSEPRPLGSGASGATPRVKILDFGLARPAWDDETHLTQTGVIVGTPAFMSPEQARGEHIDPRSDLFSLGCVLYRMVTGQQPFKGRDMVSMLLSLAQDHPTPPRELNPQVPPALNRLIQQLLAKDVADRPSSAEAVVRALQTLPSEAEPPPIPPPLPQLAPRPRRRRRVPMALTVLALLGTAALLSGIVIYIIKDGKKTTVEPPAGSTIKIDGSGNVEVILPDAPKQSRDRQEAVVPPLAEGTEALGTFALVQRPARLKGVRSWTIDTRSLRGGAGACAMRPDGRQLAVGSYDGVIRIYDPSTGQLQQALFGQQKDPPCFSLAWSPDGKRLASRYYDTNVVHIWNAATGQILRTLHHSIPGGSPLAWSPDGKLLAVGSNAGVTLWNAESWQQLPILSGGGNIFSLAWSRDSKMLAAGGNVIPKAVWLWEVPSGKLVHALEGLRYVNALAFSPDGMTLVTEDTDQTGRTQVPKVCRLRDAHSGKPLRSLELQGEATSAAFSADGKILAIGAAPPLYVQLFDTESWKPLRKLWSTGQGYIKDLVWFPDGATIAAACNASHVSILDVRTGKEVRRINHHPPGRGYNAWFPMVSWSSDGKKIASAYGWEGFRIWDEESGTQLRRIKGYANASAWSPRTNTLAGIRENGSIELYDGDSGQRFRSWEAPVFPPIPPTWSPDGKFLATAGNDKTVQVWAAASGRLVHTLKGHTANANVLAWSPDGKLIASGSAGDKTVRLWDATSGKQVHSFDADNCIRLAWSPDGQSLASGTFGDTRTWDMATKELQIRCEGPLLGWSADSKAVMTEGGEMVRWWDRQTGELLRRKEFPLLASPVLSPNSQFVAVPRDGALHIGDIESGKFALTLVPLRGGQWLAVRPDGHYRGSPGVEKEIVYIVQTDAGQELLAPDAFAKKYGWKNDPQSVRLPRHSAP